MCKRKSPFVNHKRKQKLKNSAFIVSFVFIIAAAPSLLSGIFTELSTETVGSNEHSLAAYGQEAAQRQVLWVDVRDFISPATSEHVGSAIDRASDMPREFSAVIIALDTPGGSVEATLDIIDHIHRSEVPVIGYVYPQGKSAWSAGTIILLGTNYASMAPFTTIGSAQPVLGGVPVEDDKVIKAITEKVVTLAELHNRNVTQSTRFITHNDNLTPEGALRNNVIETIAENPQELLRNAHNSTVNTLAGPKVLTTENAQIVIHEPSLRVMLVDVIANPLVSTTLLTVGFFALIYGLTSPGFGGEIAGAAMIILALIGQGFDINWAAFALLGKGVGLIAYELYSPGFGALGIGGIIVLMIGSTLMITQPVRPLLITEAHLSNLAMMSTVIIIPFGTFFGLITYKAWKAKRKKPVEFMFKNEEGTALDPISTGKPGFVAVGGEYWRAKTVSGIEIGKGEKVRITGKEADLLLVEPLQKEETP
jgi:membrane-bound serine protease (ClpP class)